MAGGYTTMRIGICTSPEFLTDAAEAGYAYAEMTCATLLYDQDEAAFAPARKQYLDSPISIEAFNVFLPGTHRVTGPDVDLKKVGAHMEIVLRRASEVGASIMVFGSGGARKLPEGWPLEKGRQQYVEAARLAGEIAAKYGMTIALEPLLKRACNFFNRTDQGSEFVDLIAHPNVKLLTDLYHIAWEGEPFEHMVDAGPKLGHIHLATPCIPATGDDGGPGYDFKAFLSTLACAGYDGRITVEDNPGLLAKVDPANMRDVYRTVREYVEYCLPVKA